MSARLPPAACACSAVVRRGQWTRLDRCWRQWASESFTVSKPTLLLFLRSILCVCRPVYNNNNVCWWLQHLPSPCQAAGQLTRAGAQCAMLYCVPARRRRQRQWPERQAVQQPGACRQHGSGVGGAGTGQAPGPGALLLPAYPALLLLVPLALRLLSVAPVRMPEASLPPTQFLACPNVRSTCVPCLPADSVHLQRRSRRCSVRSSTPPQPAAGPATLTTPPPGSWRGCPPPGPTRAASPAS
jgi:hypothetical protein